MLDELAVAWSRLKFDLRDRSFVTYPDLVEWIDQDLTGWLAPLAARLESAFSPKPAQPCWTPKPDYMMRPGAILHPEDEVVYNLLLGRALDRIWEAIGPSQGKIDLAYLLQPPGHKAVKWIRRGAHVWQQWREKSVASLHADVAYVVTADIAGFYENIDLDRLLSDLRGQKWPEGDLKLLASCLRRWAGSRARGIPQGYSASDILAKVYLDPIDHALANYGYRHLRYVDDIRIFCRDRNEAKRAIIRLTELLSARGLNLQSAKTRILSRADAHSEFEGVSQILAGVTEELRRDLIEAAGMDEYASTSEMFDILSTQTGTPPLVLERTFEDHFALAGSERFDKTLFHFLLSRLGTAKSRVAVPYCLQLLAQRAEETEQILRYLSAVGIEGTEKPMLLAFLESDDALYEHQNFQILRWICEQGIDHPRVVSLCRTWAFDSNRAVWFRVYAVAYLGRFGETSDLETIELKYASVSDEIEKGAFASALQRLEPGRRNTFYGRIQGDGLLVRRAVAHAKAAV